MTDEIERTLRLHATPEQVWRALTDPSELSRWFGQAADFELRPGGEGGFVWEGHGRFAMRIEVVEPPSRFSWRWARDPETAVDAGPSTLVEWTLTRRPDGGTILVLRESGFATQRDRAMNDEGWDEELGELVALVESGAHLDPRDADLP